MYSTSIAPSQYPLDLVLGSLSCSCLQGWDACSSHVEQLLKLAFLASTVPGNQFILTAILLAVLPLRWACAFLTEFLPEIVVSKGAFQDFNMHTIFVPSNTAKSAKNLVLNICQVAKDGYTYMPNFHNNYYSIFCHEIYVTLSTILDWQRYLFKWIWQ